MSGVIFNEQQQQAIVQALAQVQLPQLVFNSYASNHSSSEVTSILSFGTKPLVVLIMPPVVAKSFALQLLQVVEQYEVSTQTKVETIEVLAERIGIYNKSHES